MQLAVAMILAIATTAVLVASHPAGQDLNAAAQTSSDQTLVRDKRTIGILRDLFPNFSQIIDRKIQMITRLIFRLVGRLVLRGGGGGGGGGGGDDDRQVQITLPTYPPDELEDDEDDDTTGSTTSGDDAGETTTNSDAENSVGESKKREVRQKRDAEGNPAEEEEEEEDLEPDATGDNEVTSDDADAEADESADDDPRNKRFLNFNLGGSAGASTGGSGGGSGNFIFDIIRMLGASSLSRPPLSLHRRVLSSSPALKMAYKLVAGSGNTQSGDAQNAAVDEGKGGDAAYGVGVPGPLTRLFVVANKGVAALIQDLILRLAQTSERIVNFKARLITSII